MLLYYFQHEPSTVITELFYVDDNLSINILNDATENYIFSV